MLQEQSKPKAQRPSHVLSEKKERKPVLRKNTNTNKVQLSGKGAGIILGAVAVIAFILIFVMTKKTNAGTDADPLFYRDLVLETKKETVTDELVEQTLEKTIDDLGGYYVNVNRAAKEGDKVLITYTHLADETEDSASITIGDNDFPPEFEKGLIGLSKGGEANITISEEYGNEELRLHVDEVTEPSTDIDDEFVKNAGIEGVSTVDELKESIRTYLKETCEKQYVQNIRNEIQTKINAGGETELQPSYSLISIFELKARKEVDDLIAKYKEEGEEKTVKDLLSNQIKETGFTGSEDEYINTYALLQATNCLVYGKIAVNEGITLSEEEYYSAIASDWVQRQENYPTLSSYSQSIDREAYSQVILQDKVLDVLTEKYISGEYPVTKEDVTKENTDE